MKPVCSQIWASHSEVQLGADRNSVCLVACQLAKTVLPRFAVTHWLIVAPQFAEVIKQSHSKKQICYVIIHTNCLVLPSSRVPEMALDQKKFQKDPLMSMHHPSLLGKQLALPNT